MYGLYRILTHLIRPALPAFIERRCRAGKEDPQRLEERFGIASLPRPKGRLFWLHAASVGEAQSALILIDALLRIDPALHILVTTGTRTSADMMNKKLPDRALHQYYPLDHPVYTQRFLQHWSPDMVLWMESELWPNMLHDLKARNIPAALVNARLSRRSFKRWRFFRGFARRLLQSFSIILCQTPESAAYFQALGAEHAVLTDNLKYSAAPLPFDEQDLKRLSGHIMNRPLWLYASSHKGEEAIACRTHQILKAALPDLLTVIVPRHPERRAEIEAVCKNHNLSCVLRGSDKAMPVHDTDIYIADTMGELGLFYRLAQIACIGRSLSDDGGGGHNPIEAAQLGCAVLHGPHIQYQQQIYDDMNDALAARAVRNEQDLINALRTLLTQPAKLDELQKRGLAFAHEKERVIERVMKELAPLLDMNKGAL